MGIQIRYFLHVRRLFCRFTRTQVKFPHKKNKYFSVLACYTQEVI